MDETLMKELIEVLNQNNNLSWETIINLLSVIGSWITILFLLIERREANRPYLQVSFELIRDSLACIVFRNVGTVPLTIKKITFDNKFIQQLPEKERKHFENKDNVSIDIYPNRYWVLCLGVPVFTILQKYEIKTLSIKCEYSKYKKKKKYKEQPTIDFDEYGSFMVYISETDELRRVNKEISKNIDTNTKQLHRIYSILEKYAALEDDWLNVVAGIYQEDENE